MENANLSVIISIVISALSAAMIMYVVRKQFYEVLLPRDWLTRLRWMILLLLLAAILGIIPGITYRIFRLLGTDSQTLRSIATVTSSVSQLATSTLLVMIYNYRRKE